LSWKISGRHKISQALLLIDIDHFKKFNDQHGHLCGDACLVHVAQTISQQIKRKTDIVARFGGEEFVVLLSGSNVSEATRAAEKIRRSIESSPFQYDGKTLSVTASIGVAALIPKAETEKAGLIEAADKAMYLAKKAGRNRVKSTD